MHSPSALRQSGIWPEDAHDSFNKYESKLIQIACVLANERQQPEARGLLNEYKGL